MSIYSRLPGPHNQDSVWLTETDRHGGQTAPLQMADLDLQSVLAGLAPLPKHAVFLGICEDGLPLLMDLTNGAPGSVLIVGDRLDANRNLMRVMLASILYNGVPDHVEIDLITPHPEAFAEFSVIPHFIRIADPYAADISEVIWDYITDANQRTTRSGRIVKLVFIDDLEALLSQLDTDLLGGLSWLVSFGPTAKTWVFASFDARRFRQVDDQVFQAFGTRVVGHLPALRFTEYLSGLPAHVSATLSSGEQFCAEIAGELVKFWLPSYEVTALPQGWIIDRK